jgi:hypothetical protein
MLTSAKVGQRKRTRETQRTQRILENFTPLLAPPSIPPQRGEEKDKPLIWEGLGLIRINFSR